MKITKYELVKEYPGSPKIGSFLHSSDNAFYSINPLAFPEFWKELDNTSISIMSQDGKEMFKGDKYFFVDGFMIHAGHVIEPSRIDWKIWDKREEAEKYVESQIRFECEDSTILGEDLPVYGVLNKAGWDYRESTTLKMMQVKKLSSNWIFFSSEELRDMYVLENKPTLSLNDLYKIIDENWDNKKVVEYIKNKITFKNDDI